MVPPHTKQTNKMGNTLDVDVFTPMEAVDHRKNLELVFETQQKEQEQQQKEPTFLEQYHCQRILMAFNANILQGKYPPHLLYGFENQSFATQQCVKQKLTKRGWTVKQSSNSSFVWG